MRGLAKTLNACICTSHPWAEKCVTGGTSFSSLVVRGLWVMNLVVDISPWTDKLSLVCSEQAESWFYSVSHLSGGGKGKAIVWNKLSDFEQSRASIAKTTWKTSQVTRSEVQNRAEIGKGRTWTVCRSCRECEMKGF